MAPRRVARARALVSLVPPLLLLLLQSQDCIKVNADGDTDDFFDGGDAPVPAQRARPALLAKPARALTAGTGRAVAGSSTLPVVGARSLAAGRAPASARGLPGTGVAAPRGLAAAAAAAAVRPRPPGVGVVFATLVAPDAQQWSSGTDATRQAQHIEAVGDMAYRSGPGHTAVRPDVEEHFREEDQAGADRHVTRAARFVAQLRHFNITGRQVVILATSDVKPASLVSLRERPSS